jgi:hypothetical protein
MTRDDHLTRYGPPAMNVKGDEVKKKRMVSFVLQHDRLPEIIA